MDFAALNNQTSHLFLQRQPMNFSEAIIFIIKLISFFDSTNRMNFAACQGSMIQQTCPSDN